MLLSIDRVLQLLAEGKSLEKIAELSGAGADDVSHVVEEARKLLNTYDKARVRKKIIIRRKLEDNFPEHVSRPPEEGEEPAIDENEIFYGAELSAVPLNSSLTMYIDGASSGNPGPSGIGIVITDKEDRQVGKVSVPIGVATNNVAEYSALLRALKIAIYYKTNVLRIRSDSELIVKQMKGEYRVNHENIKPLYEEAVRLRKMISNVRIEHVSRSINEKADFLAKKAVILPPRP